MVIQLFKVVTGVTLLAFAARVFATQDISIDQTFLAKFQIFGLPCRAPILISAFIKFEWASTSLERVVIVKALEFVWALASIWTRLHAVGLYDVPMINVRFHF
jgi:hypothetical protein